jgi:hypothetical protein
MNATQMDYHCVYLLCVCDLTDFLCAAQKVNNLFTTDIFCIKVGVQYLH